MREKVLFVDDDAKILAAFRRRLRKRFSIETVLGGPEGLELIESDGPFAVVVADYCMPQMNGVEFLAKVREVAPDAVRMMLTGSADLQSAVQAVNEGNIFRFLTKPCSIDALSETIHSGIEEYNRASREKAFLRKNCDLLSQANEVQQSLMPTEAMEIDGIDIAGQSLYCDETGGDYYDYFEKGDPGSGRVGMVVGDVSDHGVPSALLMTTARAFLRERALRAGSLSQIVSDVNRQLTRDMNISSRFMTLFYSEIDLTAKLVRWVRAGHDPAMLYSLNSDGFSELAGQGGLPLGVFDDSTYEEHSQPIQPGQIILIATDGIWEARNPAGEVFGKERIRTTMRAKADCSAKEIVQCIMKDLDRFIHPLKVEDDATVVVLKLT